MLGRMYDGEVCSAARTLELVGERWSLLIVRNAMFAGMSRFTEFQRALGIAPNILTKRLAEFVEAGIFEQRTGTGSGHPEYLLTTKGLDLKPVILALTAWGDRWAAPDGPPVTYRHAGCGGKVHVRLDCSDCDATPGLAEVTAELAPWAYELKYGTPPSVQ
ncbi:winged helix-turn-helix transcriptional regulator [Nocardia aurantiaca]|uniref:Transcriptional regulator n=1 Tax=Nocardia aurantiaca TaxID=2675850 RepID=A0A6I3KZ88_9NOCA|nr:helix-turn-helix domain-containing protein [Nocardia aurantiaca]MTE14811.1 transcriptional regulator [Nocardia aurantiaca]